MGWGEGPKGGVCCMDLGYDGRTLDLRKRLLAFMDERVYPAEAVFAEQVEAAVQKGYPWERVPVTGELKAEARSRGLWNLFLTGRAAEAVPKLDAARSAEAGTNLPDPPPPHPHYTPLAPTP